MREVNALISETEGKLMIAYAPWFYAKTDTIIDTEQRIHLET